MRHMRYLSLIAIIMLIAFRAFAQDDDPRHASVRLIGQSYGDSVVLRLGVTRPGAWRIANKAGYRVERVSMDTSGAFDRRAFRAMTAQPLKPWPLEDWKAHLGNVKDSDLIYAGIAAQMIYGKTSPPTAKNGNGLDPLLAAAQELEDRYSFALFAADIDARAAEGSGLRVVDRDVHLGDHVVYRAFVAGGDPTYKIDTAYLIVEVTKYAPPPPPQQFRFDTADAKVKLRWFHPAEGGYTAYHVYRSDDNGRSYRRISTTPIIAMTPKGGKLPQPEFDDTNIVNYRSYRYQIRGITPFAELSEPAEVTAIAMDFTAPPAPIPDDPVQIGTHDVELTWHEPKAPGDLSGFIIARSSNSLTGFHAVTPKPLPTSQLSFVDKNASEAEPYYLVAAIDTAGNFSRSIVVSAEIIDSTPPSIPTGLTGTMDTSGVVQLRWKRGPEPSLIGYRVLWANDPSHEFTQRTPTVWQDTVFTDTVEVHTQTPAVYYRVVAVNIRKNHSEMSPMFAVKRPDIVPPAASMFTNVSVSDSSTELHWAHSRSEDVAKQLLFRRNVWPDNVHTDEWQQIKDFPSTIEYYSDRKVSQNTMYQYQLVTVDSAGNRSTPSNVVQLRPYDPGTRPAVKNISAIYDEKSKTVKLTWSYDARSEDYWFTVYRSQENLPIAQYRAVDKNTLTFEDNAISTGSYSYAVRMNAKSGAQSPLSTPVSVSVR
jgi:hypothetical protein